MRERQPKAGNGMIFGFNTDIKHEGTVYHVQSEAGSRRRSCKRKSFCAAGASQTRLPLW